MASERIALDTLEDFLAALRRDGITGIGLRSVHEIRPYQAGASGIHVGVQKWVELAGYKQGRLYVAKLDGESGPALEAQLKREGFTVRSGTNNLT
jgi:hypothetical protein